MVKMRSSALDIWRYLLKKWNAMKYLAKIVEISEEISNLSD